uniref:AAA+ ATPase domain-containing protein n=1 Tax=Leersia perrieri TaxID=77586 RepID=A0A0D9X7R9_9ORYZ
MVGATASALIGVMNPLLAKLSSLLVRECDKLKGVGREVELLRDELRSIKTALVAMTETEEPSSQVKEWMRQLRELSYDVEDCIDVFMHHLGQPDPDDGLFRRTKRRLKALRGRRCIASQVAELKERAVVVNERRKRYELDAAASSSGAVTIDSRLPALFKEMDRLVGIQGPRDELVKFLTGVDLAPQRRVLSIVGFGGLGKTTLANQVYQHIKSQFDCTAFVSVSRKPNINKILAKILIGILDTRNLSSIHQKRHCDTIEDLKYKTFEDELLISMIRENLQNSRYFIVIDDIWSISAWQGHLRLAFLENNSASRIITTTRNTDIAKACHFSDENYVYFMKPLSSENSKELFFRTIFSSNKKCPPELEGVTNDILKKCGGLPLAIVSIASLLSCKPVTKQEWVWVLNSFGSTVMQNQGSHELAVYFPEDYTITREFLILRWIAEGFITEQQGENLEEVGEQYFNELINRNMIHVFEMDIFSREENYRVHDIMLDLIISLAAEENFAIILDDQHCAPSPNKIRRLSLQCKSEEKITWLKTTSFCNARSISVFGDFNKIPPLKDLEVLRVLDLMDCSSLKDDCIENIGSLSQLRYVRLGNVSKIPRQIGKLKLLQTLDLRGTEVKKLPESIVKLLQLVRLFLSCGVELPNGIGNMEALQVLSSFDGTVNSLSIIQELGNLTKLKDLEVFWIYDDKYSSGKMYNNQLVMSLCKLGGFNLRSLIISGVDYPLDFMADSWSPPPFHLQTFQVDMACYFSSLPKWVSPLSKLTWLSIRLTKVGGEDLEVLKCLPALLRLDLYTMGYKNTLKISCGGFSCLEEFSYGPSPFDLGIMAISKNVRNGLGMGLTFEAGAMLKLQQLEFGFNAHNALSAYGARLDFGIQHLTSLRHVRAFIDGRDASDSEMEAAVTAFAISVSFLQSSLVEICRILNKVANDEKK